MSVDIFRKRQFLGVFMKRQQTKSCELRMYVNLHWMYITAEISLTVGGFLNGSIVFLEVSIGLCHNTQLYGLKAEETRALLYLST